ncbi:MAG: helix-turn-helix domain-containing protein [archaeon]
MLEKLQRIGLSKKESEIYLALAKRVGATANQLSKETSSNRTVCYNVLQQLVEKGIVTYAKKNGTRIFAAANPDSLLAGIREKEDIASELIGQLKKIRRDQATERSVEVFEGKDGLRQVFNEIRDCRELSVINATGLIFQSLPFSAMHVVKDIERSRKVRIIATQSMKKTKLSEMSRAKIKYLPAEAENYATTFIFEGKVIILTLKDKPFMVKIEEKSIYDGYRKDFDVLWNRL